MKTVCSILFLSLAVFFRAQAQNVGIGIAAPTYPLTVQGTSLGRGVTVKNGAIEVGLFNNGTVAFLQTWSGHDLNFATGNGGAKLTLSYATGNVGINTPDPTAQLDINGTLRLRNNGAGAGKVLTSDAAGAATWQSPAASKTIKTSFSADQTIAANSYQTVKFLKTATSAFNEFPDNAFNNATGVFTVQETGTYLLNTQIRWSSSAAFNQIYLFSTYIFKKGSSSQDIAGTYQDMASDPSSTGLPSPFQTLTTVAQLSAGDEISVRVYHTCTSGTIQVISPLSGQYSFFSITKL